MSGGSEATGSASVGGVITAPTGAGGAPNALYLAVMAPMPGYPFNQATTDWWLADTTGQLAPASAHNTLDLINVPWTTFDGAPNQIGRAHV